MLLIQIKTDFQLFENFWQKLEKNFPDIAEIILR